MDICTYGYRYIFIYIYMELSENGNFRLFAANGIRKFGFFGLQTVNGN